MWIGQLGRIGNSLNQIARVANQGTTISLSAVQQARDELQQLRQLIVALSRDGEDE